MLFVDILLLFFSLFRACGVEYETSLILQASQGRTIVLKYLVLFERKRSRYINAKTFLFGKKRELFLSKKKKISKCFFPTLLACFLKKKHFFNHENNSLTNEVGEAQVSRVISAARDTSKRSNLDSKSSNPKLLKLETHNSEKYLIIGR